MDPLHNPFSPGAGAPPPELAGRKDLLNQAMMTLARVKKGRAEKSMLIIGLRGTGKTVLLHGISELAKNEGYQTAFVEANEKKTLPELLLPELRRVLFMLDAGNSGVSVKVKKALRILKSFAGSIKKVNIKIQGIIDMGV